MSDLPRYSAGAHLLDHWLSCLLAVAACVGLAAVLPIMGVSLHGCLFAVGLVAACFAGAGLWNYARTARYWREAAALVGQAEHACEVPDLLDEPSFLAGRMAHGTLEAVARAASAENLELRQANREYAEYVELWVHEAKTPIAGAKLVLAGLHGPEAATLKSEIERVEAQVEQALYAARSSSLSNDYAIRETDLAQAAREAVKRNAHLLVGAQVAVAFEVPEGTSVLADRPWLVFCLQQVVVNAAKYGARTIAFRCSVEEAGTPRGRTLLAVVDDGCGIPAADVPRVFDRGFTGQVGRAHGSATGMGLHLVAVLCERMGLGVELESEEGAGTTVTFGFPHDRRRYLTRS